MIALNNPAIAVHVGQPLAEYRSRSFNRTGGPVITVTSLLILLASWLTHWSFLLVPFAICLVLFPFGLIITLYGLNQRGVRVVLCTDGLIYERNGQTFPVQWRHIATVQEHMTRHFVNFVYIGKSIAYIVYTTTGERLVLDGSIKGVRELGEKVQTAVALHQHSPVNRT